jgi:REP element-mobilizing transposase RayT
MFHIKNQNCFIHPEDENELYSYIGGTIQVSKSIPLIINGTENHIHVLFILSKNISLADLMEDIKKNSSRWIKNRGHHYTSALPTASPGLSHSAARFNGANSSIKDIISEHFTPITLHPFFLLFETLYYFLKSFLQIYEPLIFIFGNS